MDDSKPTACKCGSELFYRLSPIRGRWVEVLRLDPENGEYKIDESNTDSIIHDSTIPATIKCADCGKRRVNPDKFVPSQINHEYYK